MKQISVWFLAYIDLRSMMRTSDDSCENISDQLNVLRDQILTTNERLLEFMNIVNNQIFFKRSISTDITLQSETSHDIDYSPWRPWSLEDCAI